MPIEVSLLGYTKGRTGEELVRPFFLCKFNGSRAG